MNQTTAQVQSTGFVQGLGLLDSTMIVAGLFSGPAFFITAMITGSKKSIEILKFFSYLLQEFLQVVSLSIFTLKRLNLK